MARDRLPQISVSHEVIPLMKLVSGATRGGGCLSLAAAAPLRRPRRARAADVPLKFMQSNGGLTSRAFQARTACSRPAGASWALRVRRQRRASTDHRLEWRTSTDVSIAMPLRRHLRQRRRGRALRAPMMSITRSPPRGSILHFDGALPGGTGFSRRATRSGVLPQRRPIDGHRRERIARKISPISFRRFGPRGITDHPPCREKFSALAADIAATGDARAVEAIAEGYLRVAVDNMATPSRNLVGRTRRYGYTLCCSEAPPAARVRCGRAGDPGIFIIPTRACFPYAWARRYQRPARTGD